MLQQNSVLITPIPFARKLTSELNHLLKEELKENHFPNDSIHKEWEYLNNKAAHPGLYPYLEDPEKMKDYKDFLSKTIKERLERSGDSNIHFLETIML